MLSELVEAIGVGEIAGSLRAQLVAELGEFVLHAPVQRDDLVFEAELAVFDYWQSLENVDGVAQADTVDPLKIRSALGSVMLLNVIDGGKDFYYSLYGSKIANVAGFDMTHKYLRDLPSNNAVQTFFLAGYRSVVQHRLPIQTVHPAPDNIMIGSWRRLQLPLGRGDEIRRILVCNIPTHTDGVPK